MRVPPMAERHRVPASGDHVEVCERVGCVPALEVAVLWVLAQVVAQRVGGALADLLCGYAVELLQDLSV